MRRTRVGRVPRWQYAAALAAGLVLVAAAASAGAPASTASKWTLESGYTSENGTPQKLSAVSCTSTGWCAEVGYNVPLADSWNGKVWSPMSDVDDSPSVIPPEFFSGRGVHHGHALQGRRRRHRGLHAQLTRRPYPSIPYNARTLSPKNFRRRGSSNCPASSSRSVM